MYYDQLTSPQIAEIDKSTPVILPIAATEQHGPHLPLATDRMIGEHFCAMLNEAMPKDVLILPAIGIGCSEHHTVFAGSLSYRHETMLQQMQDIFHWITHYGFSNLIVFNSHGGNQAIGKTFLESFGFRHPQCKVVFVTWWQLIHQQLLKIAEGGPDATGHAGELETSLILLIAPHLVQMDKAPDFANTSTYDWAKVNMLEGTKASLYRNFKQISPTGVMGTPKLGTREKGIAITVAVLDELKKVVINLKLSKFE